jgi:XTP/dITP diphosphohydrolase
MTLVFATNNPHKLEEVRQLAGPFLLIKSLEEIGCREELPETQPTLEGNALQKARYVYDRFGYPCFADDTGLEVEALNGAPGVYSARYAGEQRSSTANIQLLLRNLQGQPNRKARFRTVVCLVESSGIQSFEGIVNGSIITEPRGLGGFGYDPVFQVEETSRTLAELSAEEKNNISHRGHAIRKLMDYLQKKYGRSAHSL